MAEAILALNAGSSSLRFALHAVTGAPGRRHLVGILLAGACVGIGEAPALAIGDEQPTPLPHEATHEDALAAILARVADLAPAPHLRGVGHRVVHGGPDHDGPAAVDAALIRCLEAMVPLAPLHQPHAIAGIRAAAALAPGTPQFACFDTAFHHAMPLVAREIALPAELLGPEIRRYGFHGLSYAFIARRLREERPALASGRVVVAHLGSGASLCAMHDGQSVDTTMGFTPLDGLLMSTRVGRIDPGLLLHLQETRGLDAKALEDALSRRSGLLALSGHSGDMRTLLAGATARDRHAVEAFAYRAAGEIAAMVASLGGIDALVFTAGIGENAPMVRAAIAARLGWLGVSIDVAANMANAGSIGARGGAVAVLVMKTDEAQMVAQHVLERLDA